MTRTLTRISILFMLNVLPFCLTAQWEYTGGPKRHAAFTVKKTDNYIICVQQGDIYRRQINGTVWSLSMDGLPTDYDFFNLTVCGNQVFLFGNSGGYISNDEGGTWLPSQPSPPTNTISSYTRLLESGEFLVSWYDTISNEQSWFFSNDCGQNFSPLSMEPVYSPSNFTKFDDGTLCIYGWALNNEQHIVASTDNGATWEDLGIPNFPPALYFYQSVQLNNLLLAPGGDGAVYISDDYGLNWEPSPGIPVFLTIANLQVSGDIVWLNTFDDTNRYFSTDGGQTWDLAFEGLPHNGESLFFNGDDIYVRWNGTALYHSTNLGADYVQIPLNFPIEFSYPSVLLPGQSIILFGEGGINTSDNGGVAWHSDTEGLPETGALIWEFFENDGTLFGCGPGIFRSNDSGDTWERSNNGALALMNFDFASGDIDTKGDGLIAAGGDDKLYESQDNGLTWNVLPSYIPSGNTGGGITAIAQFNDQLVVSFDTELYFSDDQGASWNMVTNPGMLRILNMEVANGKLVVATDGNGIYYSDELPFFQQASGLTELYSALCMTEENGVLYASGFTTDNKFSVYISGNGGVNWSRIYLPSEESFNLSWDIDARDSVVILSELNTGVWLSKDYGDNWFNINENLEPGDFITGVWVGAENLYLGAGDGVWRRPLSDFGIVGGSTTVAEPFGIQLSPNPAHDFLKLEVKEEVNLKNATIIIFDSNGRMLQIFPMDGTTLVVPVEHLLPGLYSAMIRSDKGEVSRQFVKH